MHAINTADSQNFTHAHCGIVKSLPLKLRENISQEIRVEIGILRVESLDFNAQRKAFRHPLDVAWEHVVREEAHGSRLQIDESVTPNRAMQFEPCWLSLDCNKPEQRGSEKPPVLAFSLVVPCCSCLNPKPRAPSRRIPSHASVSCSRETCLPTSPASCDSSHRRETFWRCDPDSVSFCDVAARSCKHVASCKWFLSS